MWPISNIFYACGTGETCWSNRSMRLLGMWGLSRVSHHRSQPYGSLRKTLGFLSWIVLSRVAATIKAGLIQLKPPIWILGDCGQLGLSNWHQWYSWDILGHPWIELSSFVGGGPLDWFNSTQASKIWILGDCGKLDLSSQSYISLSNTLDSGQVTKKGKLDANNPKYRPLDKNSLIYRFVQ